MNDLAESLKQAFEHAPEASRMLAVQSFGIKYAKQIAEGNYNVEDIVKAAGIPESYQAKVNEGIQLYNVFGVSSDSEPTTPAEELSSQAADPKAMAEKVDEWYGERAIGGFNKM